MAWDLLVSGSATAGKISRMILGRLVSYLVDIFFWLRLWAAACTTQLAMAKQHISYGDGGLHYTTLDISKNQKSKDWIMT